MLTVYITPKFQGLLLHHLLILMNRIDSVSQERFDTPVSLLQMQHFVVLLMCRLILIEWHVYEHF